MSTPPVPLAPGQRVRLVSLPTGQGTRDLPLTVGGQYVVRYCDGSNVVVSTNDPTLDGSIWRGRVEPLAPSADA